MHRPALLPTNAVGETFGGITYHLDGELVPALTVELTPGASVYFEHHTLLWKNVSVTIGIKTLSGAFKRMFAGLPILMTEAHGQGQIAFSRDGAGHIFPMHLSRGQGIHVREHQFLAATHGIDYSFERIRGISNILFGGNQFFIDKFVGRDDGIVWLHGYGNVFEITLAAGESIEVEPGAWLYKDPSVTMTTTLTKFSTGMFGGNSFMLNRFTGPGRMGLQSMSLMAQFLSEMGKSGGGSAVQTAATMGIGSMLLGALMGNRRS